MSAKKDSSSVTMADLNMAIKPLMETFNKLREELSSNGSQLSEILQIVTGLSVKFDTVEQTVSNLNDESKVPKKTGGRKPAAKGAKKPAAKKAATKKKVVEPVDDGAADEDADLEDDATTAADVDADLDDDATTAADVDADVDGTTDAVDVVEDVKTTKKAPPKKSAAVVAKTTKTATATAAPVKPVPKKAAIKAPAKDSTTAKDAVKKDPVKKAKAPAKKAITRVYKMNLFKEAYTEDPKRFNKQLTKEVLNTIAAENKEKWSELSGEKLELEKIAAYFHYVKNNHDDVLEDLKKKFLATDGNGNADVGDDDDVNDADE